MRRLWNPANRHQGRRVGLHAAAYGICLAALAVGGSALSSRLMAWRDRPRRVWRGPAAAVWRRAREATREHRSLHSAVWKRDAMAVAAFVLQGADVDALDQTGQTPLHAAALRGYDDVARVLIAGGADVQARGNGGQTPLHNTLLDLGCWDHPPLVDHGGRLRVAELLVESGADVNVVDREGWTPLHVAASQGWRGGGHVGLLLSKGADIDAKDRRGHTPLDVAVRNMQRQMVECLIANGADTEAKDNEGRTASAVSGRPGPHGPGWRRGGYLALGQAAMRKPPWWLTW